MDYTERLENVTVLGAAGKMGSGILLLTAMEMADLSLRPENKNRVFVLNAIDVSHQALSAVMRFLSTQVLKAAEKKIVQLRKVYEDNAEVVENAEVISRYVTDVLNVVRPSTVLQASQESALIFDAVSENPELKINLFSQINRDSRVEPWFFTNTSSIPIHELNARAGLDGRILGVHFYNPPAVQKLVEIIRAKETRPELADFAGKLVRNLRKIAVYSNDFAGFIGNGHFMRDILHAFSEVHDLAGSMPVVQALYTVNKVSQDYLVRPMGIFQLIDYVGLDVCQCILSIMRPHVLDEDFHSDLLVRFIEAGIKGGQFADGSQKDGIFKYDKGRPAAIFDPESAKYEPLAYVQGACEALLGPMPASARPWKAIIGSPDKDKLLHNFFLELNNSDTLGARLAKRYGIRSQEIARKLVRDGVARNAEDVNTVLLTGFYHAYGPINDYFHEAR